MLNKYLFHFFLFFQFFILNVSAQKTIISENFGGSYTHNESMSSNSSGWIHTGTGDFVNKEVSASGALASNCFGQLTLLELQQLPMMFSSMPTKLMNLKPMLKPFKVEFMLL